MPHRAPAVSAAPVGQDFMTHAMQFFQSGMNSFNDMAANGGMSGGMSGSQAMDAAHQFFSSLLGASQPPSAGQGVFHTIETASDGNVVCLEMDVTPTNMVEMLNITGATPGKCEEDVSVQGVWDTLDSQKMRINSKLYGLKS